MSYPFGKTVTLVGRVKTSTDSDGNDVLTSTLTTLERCPFWWGTTTEQTQARDTVTSDATVILPVDTDVSAVDAVTVDGQTFQVDGVPMPWESPFTGWEPGIEVRLRRVTG